ncbi:hypothetical protein SMGD1_1462 [Sulfurimonas gotlandica GD1]|uniref:Uncharacterized protein n=1 Tax=Sulfurimonas gotlandica (strain DSM 19862 / JCM 16533 / GD1) TaxID=929558 RepID=B6BHI9_SULGG|nr:hypothetical protein CBGD1_827 [Sulfurimonas gotlandica GD1]EHP29986.1 hypothetical protein SMGD1_1462 [Sulfurimonas gotlandica GD1]
MQHIYLSETIIDEALKNNQITQREAKKLKKKIDCQLFIFKTINR